MVYGESQAKTPQNRLKKRAKGLLPEDEQTMATDPGERLARRTPEPRNRPKWVPFFLAGFLTIAPFLGMWDGRRASARTGGERSRSGDLLQLELRRPEWLTETRRKNLIKWGGSACVLVGVLDNPEKYFR